MGYETEKEMTAGIEGAKNFAVIQAFGDTVHARMAASGLAHWTQQRFDPTRNLIELLRILNDPDHPVRTLGVDVDYDTTAANRQSGARSLWIKPVGPPSLSEIRFKTPVFRIVDGERYTVKLRHKGDAGTSITFGFWGVKADGTEVAMGSGSVSPTLTWAQGTNTVTFTTTPANPHVGAYIEVLTNNGNVARNIWFDELTAAVDTSRVSFAGRIGTSAAKAAGWNRLPFNTVRYDSHAAFSTTNNRWTAPRAMRVRVSMNFFWVTPVAGELISGGIYKNSVLYLHVGHHSATVAASDRQCEGTCSIDMAAGDYLEAWGYHAAAGNYGQLTAATDNDFSIEEI